MFLNAKSFITLLFVYSTLLAFNVDAAVTIAESTITDTDTDEIEINSTQIVNELPFIFEQINLAPWQTYQKLIILNDHFETLSSENQLLFLLRKAQAENLLYFYDEFEKSVKDAQKLITTETPADISSDITFFAGIVAQRDNNYNQAVQLFNVSMAFAKKAGAQKHYVQAKSELAYTRSLTEEFETSLIDLQAAYVEAFALQDDLLLAMINESYGAIYGYMGEHDKSISYYKKALLSYQSFDYPAHVAEAIFGIATTYRYWRKFDLALEYYQQYQQAILYTPNKNISFFAYYGLGMTLAGKGDCIKAITAIDKGIKFTGFIDYYAELYKRKAECLLVLNRIDEAEAALKQAENIFNQLPELKGTTWQIEVIKIASAIAFAQKNYTQAYQLQQKYYQQYTHLLVQNSSKRLAKVRGALELEQKNMEITLLNQQAKVHQLKVNQQLQKNRQQQYLISGIIFVILLCIVVLVIQYKNNKKVLALSVVDPLSNLYNRRFTFEFLENLLSSRDQEKGQLSIILLDIDNFKHVNDIYGHPFGDAVIKQVAEIGKLTLRGEDVMGRIGGEEFLCILPRMEATQSLIIAERLRENISQHCFEINKQAAPKEEKDVVTVTVSIGISSLSDSAHDSASLYLQADTALYQAKNKGKNKVVVYQEPSLVNTEASNKNA